MESTPNGIKVRYSLRCAAAPIILAGSLSWLSESLLALVLLGVFGLVLAVFIAVRPYLRVRNGEAHYVSLVSPRTYPAASVDEVLTAGWSLKWFLRRGDLMRLQRLQSQPG